jgi:transposase
MTSLYGRSLRGERACGERPASKGQRISMIGALDINGLLDCMCFGGTLNGTVFSYYIENFLMKYLAPGKTVIFDNASPHKNQEALNLIEKSGADILFLPSYCPDLNPIEFCWSKIKHFLRNLKARTAEELYRGYADSLKLIDSKMAAACFRHCGL